jgi:hypothetical protein
MERHAFITGLAAVVTAPRVAHAEQAGKVATVGALSLLNVINNPKYTVRPEPDDTVAIVSQLRAAASKETGS